MRCSRSARWTRRALYWRMLEQGPRRREPHLEWRVAITARADRDVQEPRGDRSRRPRRGDARRRWRFSASTATRPDWHGHGWFSPTSTGARVGSRTTMPPSRAAEGVRGAPESPRGRLGPRTDRPLRHPRPDDGRRRTPARAVAGGGAREPRPWTRTSRGLSPVLEAMSGRFDEARRHIEESRGAPHEPRPDVAGGRPRLAQRLRRVAGRRPGRRRARHAVGGGCAFGRSVKGGSCRPSRSTCRGPSTSRGATTTPSPCSEAIDEAPAPTDREWQIKRTGVPARLLARRGQLEEAEKLAREGVALAADSEFLVLHADVLLDLAEVCVWPADWRMRPRPPPKP